MTKRPTLLSRIFSRIARRKPAPQQPQHAEKPKAERPKRRTESSFEPLEGRIAPAILVSPTTVQYKDSQGDLVTVSFSKALFEPGTTLDAMLDRVFKFDTGNVRTNGDLSTVQVLQTLDFTGVTVTQLNLASSPANGVSVSITAEPQNGLGDGLVNVGYIKASQSVTNGITLGKVLVEGDLGRIDAGTAAKPVAMQSLIVNSIGMAGVATQAAGGTLASTIVGKVGTILVNTDVLDAIVSIEDANTVNGKAQKGSVGSLTINGKISSTANLTTVGAGSFSVDGDIGSLRVGTLSSHGIFGGSSADSGSIKSLGKIGAVNVKGDIRGSAGSGSGQISGLGGIGDITLSFSIFAGSGENSGRIVTQNGSIGQISLFAIRGESAVNGGASGKNAGSISAGSGIAGLTVTGVGAEGKILGGAGEGSGSVTVNNGALGKLSMQGSLAGGAGLRSGRIFAADIGDVRIGEIFGGGGAESGVLRASDDLGAVTIESLRGGTGTESGVVRAGDDLKSILINQTLIGNGGTESGSVRAGGDVGSVFVKNSANADAAITAGTGIRSGHIGLGSAGKITIQGSVDGSTPGAKEGAGSIALTGNLGALTVTKSLVGGQAEATGAVVVDGKVGSISIAENLTGGAGAYSGGISVGGAVKLISVTGNLVGGVGLGSAGIFVGTDHAIPDALSTLLIRGTVTGGEGDNSALISASGVIGKATLGNPAATISDVLLGGVGVGSGGISAGGINTLSVFGNVVGNVGGGSGGIYSSGTVTSITLTGNLSGGTGESSGSLRVVDSGKNLGNLISLKLGALIGGAGADSGQISTEGTLTSATFAQAIGGEGARSGSILAGLGDIVFVGGKLRVGDIGMVKVTGGFQSGAGEQSASLLAAGSIKSLTVGGSLSGSEISAGRDIISLASGSLQGVEIRAESRIGALKISGGVSGSQILAGYDRFGNAVNGDAQIGSVNLTGDWAGSSMVAGVLDVNSDGFGSSDDTVIPGSNAATISRIASVIIGGNVTGRFDAGQVGFVAQQIDFLSIAGAKVALTAAKNTIVLTTTLNDITIREVA